MTFPQVVEIVASQTSSLQANLPQTDCDPQRNADMDMDMDSWLRMADGLSQQESRAAIKTLPDMLPVTNPCL